jgi:hypothetical protein
VLLLVQQLLPVHQLLLLLMQPCCHGAGSAVPCS